MTARNGLRRRLWSIPAAMLVTVALPIAAASAQAPGLPRSFSVTRVDSPTPVGGGAFGWGIWSADLTDDGKQDLLVAQAQVGTATVPNKIFIFNGVTGAHVDTIDPPENNPPSATGAYQSPEMGFVYVETMPDIGSCPGGDGPDAGKICDLSAIRRGDGIPEILVGSRALRVNATNGALAPTNADRPVGRGYVIDGATRAVLKRIDMPSIDRRQNLLFAGSPAFGRTMSSPQGMPPCAGLAAENNDTGVGPCPALVRLTGDTTTGSNTIANVRSTNTENGQMIVGPYLPLGSRIASGGGTSTLVVSTPPLTTALPLGAGATDTASGVAFTVTDFRYSQAVRIGDLDGRGTPDIVITARGFPEAGQVTRNAANDGTAVDDATSTTPGDNTAASGSHCRNTAQTQPEPTAATPNPALPSCGAGKAWAYRGEDIAGSNPQTILDTPLHSPPTPGAGGVTANAGAGIQNVDSQVPPAGGEWGGNLWRVGDLAGADGIPDFVLPFRGAEHPLKAPDMNSGLNMGSAYLVNGRTGATDRTIVSPEPQIRSQFSGNFNAGRAVGDLGSTTLPDILLPAPFQNQLFADQGRVWAFNGDTGVGGGGEQSWNFGMLNDPEPYIGGNFGGGVSGVGDLVDGPGAPGNEVLVGGFRFDNFTEASQNVVPDVNFMNTTLDKNLMTIPHPEGGRGDGFGVGITPMGDLNNDKFLDFAVSAYFADGPTGGVGRAWIFKSDNSPLPPPPQPAPIATGPVTPATQDKPLVAGNCRNRMIGTDAGEMLRGTLAGDEIFGFRGNDTVMGFQGEDCVDAGSGNDTIRGGDAHDKLIGGAGGDLVWGEDGRDDVYGGSRNDRLYGGYGRDMIAGGNGDDLIQGGPDADRLFGERGKDRIVGGDGRNHLDGGDGNDSINSRNGEVDRVLCGKGRDRVTADTIDRLNACEVVSFRTPKPKKKAKS